LGGEKEREKRWGEIMVVAISGLSEIGGPC